MKKTSYFLVALAGICWGTMGIFTNGISKAGFSMEEMLFVKVVMGVLVLFPVLFYKDKKLLRIKNKYDVKYFIGTGICSFVFFSLCYMNAINTTSLGVAAVLLYTAPTIIMIFSVVFFGEKITRKKVFLLCFTFLGCVLVTGFLSGGQMYTTKGIVLGILSGFGYAFYSIFGTFAVKRGYNSLTIAFYTFTFASLFLLIFVNPVDVVIKITQKQMWIYTTVFAAVTTIVPYLAYTVGLSNIGATKASVIATIEPVCAALIGILVFAENVSVQKIIGIFLVLSTVLFVGDKKIKTE